MLLFELRVVAANVDAADSELDPVLRRRFSFFGRGAVFVDRGFIVAGAE